MEKSLIIIIAILCTYLLYENHRLTKHNSIALNMIRDLVEEMLKGDCRLEDTNDL